MSLTPAQLQTLKASVEANTDPNVTAALALGALGVVADWYNVDASPDYFVWRTSVPVDSYRAAMTWTEVDSLTAGKARIWEWLTARMTLPINAADTATRQGIADAFGPGTATRTALLAAGKRLATRAEVLFVVSGDGSSGTPGTMGWEGKLQALDIVNALGS